MDCAGAQEWQLCAPISVIGEHSFVAEQRTLSRSKPNCKSRPTGPKIEELFAMLYWDHWSRTLPTYGSEVQIASPAPFFAEHSSAD